MFEASNSGIKGKKAAPTRRMAGRMWQPSCFFLSPASLFLLLALLAPRLPGARSLNLFGRNRDPFGHFCGKEDCYEVLGLENGRQSDKEEIRKSYRALSREHHPDKGGDKALFARIAKAYEVLSNDEKREEYDFILDHPDAYTEKYGMHVVFEYAPESDVRLVILLALICFSALGWGVQTSKHNRAVRFLIAVAEANLGPNKGGTAATTALRKYAELKVGKKDGESTTAGTSPATPSSSSSKSRRKSLSKKSSSSKIINKEAREEAISLAIQEAAWRLPLAGEYRAADWRHLPVVWILMAPYTLPRWLYYLGRRLFMDPSSLTSADVLYWTRARIGWCTWEGLYDDEQEEAIKSEVHKLSHEDFVAWQEKMGFLDNDAIRICPSKVARAGSAGDEDWQACFPSKIKRT